jgi:hypothetical protein
MLRFFMSEVEKAKKRAELEKQARQSYSRGCEAAHVHHQLNAATNYLSAAKLYKRASRLTVGDERERLLYASQACRTSYAHAHVFAQARRRMDLALKS